MHMPMRGAQGCNELRAAIEASLRVLAWTLRAPHVLPGGGAWQGLLAAHMRARARAVLRRGKTVLQVGGTAWLFCSPRVAW